MTGKHVGMGNTEEFMEVSAEIRDASIKASKQDMVKAGTALAKELEEKDTGKKKKRRTKSKLSKMVATTTEKYGDVQLPKLKSRGFCILTNFILSGLLEENSLPPSLLAWVAAHQHEDRLIGKSPASMMAEAGEWIDDTITLSNLGDYTAAGLELATDLVQTSDDVEVDDSGK